MAYTLLPMRVRFFHILAMLALLACFAAGPAGASGDREKQLTELRERIQSLKQDIDRNTRKRSQVQAVVQEAEQQISLINRRLREITAERNNSQARRDQLSTQRKALLGQVGAEREALAGQVRAAYVAGREERLKLLLNQEDPAKLGRMMVYYDYFNQMRAQTIDRVSGQIRELQELDEQLEAEISRLSGLQEEREKEVARLEQARAERRQAVAKLDSELASKGNQVSQLEDQARVLEELVEELRSALRDFPVQAQEPFAKLRGKLAWPVSGRLLADFGQPRAGKRLKWQGVLVETRRGSEIRAIYHGRVAYADWLPGMGLLVILDHGDGYMSLYGHNDTLYISAGDWVAPGDVLATAGDSGGRADSALYFEIRKGKSSENPHRWFAKALSGR
ncbi:MAG: peptidoglycan DD-metalloendopeptidase family protein [Chromatiales bacterium]|nr:peptidoglycan DD-metalloendopeptidase family protein [Chromatiales bacterium]